MARRRFDFLSVPLAAVILVSCASASTPSANPTALASTPATPAALTPAPPTIAPATPAPATPTATLATASDPPATSTAAPATPPPPTISPTLPPSPTPGPTAATLVAHIKLPKNWQSVELTEASLRATLTAIGSSNPQLAQALNQLLDSGSYKHLTQYAIGYVGTSTIGNVLVTDPSSAGGFGLDAVAPSLEGVLKNLGATNYSAVHVNLPAGDALLASYDLSVTVGTRTVSITGREYVLIVDDQAFVAAFTCQVPKDARCLADASAMIKSLTIRP
jgi:hypothetical protein